LSTPGDKARRAKMKNARFFWRSHKSSPWHGRCNWLPRRKHTFVRHWLTLTMKTNTTKNLASAGILVLLSPVLLLAIIVSVKNSGVMGNDILLLLLTLTGAVVTGINGFGRRTPKAAPVATRPAKLEGSQSDSRISWSSRHSSNA
jgi:hypothetical protein